MGRINVLDPLTANKIKAGEVIERPVSVVKELVDNSIDSGASAITVEFANGGISLVRVTDNGIGMEPDDAQKAFLLHATSKIRTIEDIYELSTQGFRGEALASIASCSTCSVLTKTADNDIGTYVRYCNGIEEEVTERPCDTGTTVEVRELFANIPARYKFLKRDSTEGMYICSFMEKTAIINPDISFKVIKDGKTILTTPGNGDMRDAIYSIYGKNVTSDLVELDNEYNGIKVRGFTGKPSLVRGNRGLQYIYVNDRVIRNRSISTAIDEAYKGSVMKNRFPVCFISVLVPSNELDVNVHPQKAEVKFTNESDVFRAVYHAIKNALSGGNDDIPFTFGKEEKPGEEKKLMKEREQLRFDMSNKVTAESSKAVSDLLEILSEFKPDISSIEDKDEEIKEDAKQEELPEVKEAGTPVAIRSGDVPNDDIQRILEGRLVGFLFSTFIIIESGEDVYLIDQHAAHERVLYERFSSKKISDDERKRNVQVLLVPQIVELTAADHSFVSDNKDSFVENGFDIEVLGDRQIALRSIPIATRSEDRLKKMSKPSVIFEQVLGDLKKEVPVKGKIWDSLIQTTACKAAIKAHDKITEEEAWSLINQMRDLEDPCHCAHGRPTFFKITLTDLEKRFKRII